MDVIIYPRWDWIVSMLVEATPGEYYWDIGRDMHDGF